MPTKWQLLLVYGNALRILFFAAVVLWLPISSVAQSTFVPSAEASKVFLPLDQANDSLRGPGALWLLDRARECQYVMFGEQHGVEGIAQLVEAVYGDLQTSGFEYLALEIGPWISERLSQDGVTATIQRFPHSIAFDYDGDIQLMRFAESTSSNRGQTIWGMDQELTAIHPLQRLEELAPDLIASRMARGAFLKAALRGGQYARQDHKPDIVALRQAFGQAATPEARSIFDQLQRTMKIYVSHRAASRGEISYRQSVEMRESDMKERFDAYSEAWAQDDRPPKVVFKMGGAHIMKGIGPNGIPTLGDHVLKSAQARGESALLVGVRRLDDESQFVPQSAFQTSSMVLVDTHTYLASLRADEKRTIPTDLSADLAGFDALIYLRGAAKAGRQEMATLEAEFRAQLLRRLSWVLPPAILLLTGLIPIGMSVVAFVRKSSKATKPAWPGTTLLCLTLSTFVLLGLQIRKLLANSRFELATVSSRSVSTAWLVIFAAVAGLAVLTAIFAARRPTTMMFRVHFVVLAGSLCWLLAFMAY